MLAAKISAAGIAHRRVTLAMTALQRDACPKQHLQQLNKDLLREDRDRVRDDTQFRAFVPKP